MAVAAVMDFYIFEIVRVGKVKKVQMHRHAKFRGDALCSQAIVEIWRFFELEEGAVRHLGFLKGRNFNGR